MLGFWECINTDKSLCGVIFFFVGIGLGLLSKGPIIGVLAIPPIFIWLLRFQSFPKKGFPVTLAIGYFYCFDNFTPLVLLD